jgi:hypothetical protein
MADYFTHFSCLLDVGTPDKAARALALFQELRAADQDADDPEVAGFDLVRQDAPEGSTLWIHDDEHGDVEAVIRFVLRLAEELDLTGLWGFQYALTCSRPRLDAFGGGAHVIDLGARKSIGWTSSQEWLAAALNGEDARCLRSSAPPSTSSPNSRMPPRKRRAAGIASSAPTTIGGTRSMRISSGSAKSSASA